MNEDLKSLFFVVFHHSCNDFLTLFFQILALLIFFLLSSLFIECTYQEFPLFFLLYLANARIWIFICPSDSQDFIVVQRLIAHRFFRILCHTTMPIFDKRIAFMRQNIKIFHFAPQSEMPKQYLIHLSYAIVRVW